MTSAGSLPGRVPARLLEHLEALDAAWAPARESGVLGPQTAEALYRHALGFVPGLAALQGLETAWRRSESLRPRRPRRSARSARRLETAWRRSESLRLVDLGTGAGIPGVLLALELPSSHWTLVDARRRRCELASRAAAAAGLQDRVEVRHARIAVLARSPQTREAFDGAVARLFGPVAELAECGLPLVRRGGLLVVSVSSRTRRQWLDADLVATARCEVAGCWSTERGEFLAVKRVGAAPSRLPRRAAARKRAPLF